MLASERYKVHYGQAKEQVYNMTTEQQQNMTPAYQWGRIWEWEIGRGRLGEKEERDGEFSRLDSAVVCLVQSISHICLNFNVSTLPVPLTAVLHPSVTGSPHAS